MRLLFRPMDEVSLRLPSDPEDVKRRGTVTDFLQDERIVVETPLAEHREVEPGLRVWVEAYLPNGIHRFHVPVVRLIMFPSPRLHLGWPREAERVQRRDNVRVQHRMRVDAVDVDAGGEPLEGYTDDLSVGGMRLIVPELPAGDVLELHMHLPGVGVRQARGRVLRTGEYRRPKDEDEEGDDEKDAADAGNEASGDGPDAAVVAAAEEGREDGDGDGDGGGGGDATAGEDADEDADEDDDLLGYWLAIIFTDLPDPVSRAVTKLVFDVQREQLRNRLV